jgi:SpoIID/LytB domain protein
MLRSTVALLFIGAVLISVSVVAGAPAIGASPAAAPVAGPTFAISGRGWGHGVGMSQWGAYGFAQKGFTYRRILAHYYRGATLGRAPVSKVRVLLADGQRSVTVASESAFTVRAANDQRREVAAGSYALGPGLKLKVVGKASRIGLPGPLLFAAGKSSLELGGKPYRGSLEVSAKQGAVRVINKVGLESYIAGVVPHEMPHTWHAEALKAQAVAARSFALALRASGADFDLYNDTRSQVYGGVDAEEPETTAAAKATAGQVLTYHGKIATAFYFSTSGGRTANVEDVFGGVPVPYLTSVPDPYDSISPLHEWGPFPVSATRLAKALHSRGALLDVRITLNPSLRVDKVTGLAAAGSASVSGPDLRTALGLRSSWFTIGVLDLDRPTRPLVYGEPARVTGLAHGLTDVVLEERPSGGVWQGAGAVRRSQEGAVAVPVRPQATTEYRLAAGTLRSASVRLAVAPLVRLLRPLDHTELHGRVKPLLAGSPVVVERQTASGWARAARSTVDEKGAFATRLALTKGSYRARVPAGRGFATGISTVLRVE